MLLLLSVLACLAWVCPTPTSFERSLVSKGPSAEMSKAAAGVFDWLIGDWKVDVYDYQADGTKRVSTGEWRFSWVLNGRAIQDVWVAPPSRYGTTLRIYDPKIDAWRVNWFNPVTQDRSQLVGRRVGDTIVQQGTDDDGTFVRWTFQDITSDSFTWKGEFSNDGGRTWHLDAEFLAHRVTPGRAASS